MQSLGELVAEAMALRESTETTPPRPRRQANLRDLDRIFAGLDRLCGLGPEEDKAATSCWL
ncbi:MAG: hypothetical protein HY319_07700 [Armatimonadetes bacterium]|nr:hypothetical protein [Armatimonadota bacterium]